MTSPAYNPARILRRSPVVEEPSFHLGTAELRRILMDRLVVLETALQQIESLRPAALPRIAREIASTA